MTITISIIGLDRIGASFSLALAESGKDFYRIGYARDVKAGPQAVKDRIIDKSAFNLPAAVEKADYVVLSIPAFELQTALQVITPALKEGAVVVDTSPLKAAAMRWASELIPAGRWFVSVSPTLNPDSFADNKPSPDLFRNSLMVITAGKGTPESVVENVIGLAECVGASAQFSDPLEHDGLMAAVHQLPQIIAAAYLGSIVDRPGWMEGRKMAGADFSSISAPLQSLSGYEKPAEGVFQNRENTLRVLDNLIVNLESIREWIAADNQKEANDFFARVVGTRQTWLEQRQNADWEKSTPRQEAPPGIVSRLFGMGGKSPKK